MVKVEETNYAALNKIIFDEVKVKYTISRTLSMSNMEESTLTEATEEYLEAIYKLQERNGIARTKDLVRLLKVVPGSVTNTLERLEGRGYIVHEPYRGVRLTEEGRKIALQVIRRHRLCERLLTDVLHVEWERAHDVACKLEHAFPQDIVKRLEKSLGHPKTCPHGNPIPTDCGGIIEEESQPLTILEPGENALIIKIAEEESNILEYFAKVGIVPGATIEVLMKISGELILVKVGERSHGLSASMASSIRVRRR
jgi:DtxR family Mn-dependent transcriptional regulator